MKKKTYLPILVVTLILSCSKDNSVNPFENETILDCRDLKIRKVIISDNSVVFPGQKVFRVTMENTCKLCDTKLFHVYDSFYMIDKNSNDTIARNAAAALTPPPNKTSSDYDLETKLTSLPNLANVKFVMYSTCTDMEYEPK